MVAVVPAALDVAQVLVLVPAVLHTLSERYFVFERVLAVFLQSGLSDAAAR